MNFFPMLGLVLFLYMTSWFFISCIKKRNDVADIAWGPGFILLTWISFYLNHDSSARKILVCILVSIWGLRLALHIYARNKHKPEDYRYKQWRATWGKWFLLRSYMQIYLLQGGLLFVIALPVLIINQTTSETLNALDALGIILWCIGFYFEAVGDAQLARFSKDPNNKGKLIQSGLWAYTRHPNYFGEVTQWWGIWLIALSVPLGLLTIIGPLTITILILKISGIPMLEKKLSNNPDFAEYQKRVSIFIPLPKKFLLCFSQLKN